MSPLLTMRGYHGLPWLLMVMLLPFGFIESCIVALLGRLGRGVALLAVLLLAALLVYLLFGPPAPRLAPVQEHVVKDLVRQLTAALPAEQVTVTVLMPPVENDWGTEVGKRLRAAIEDRGVYHLAPESTWQRLAQGLHVYAKPKYDEATVRELVRDMKEDVLLLVRLQTYDDTPRETFAEMNAALIGKAGGASQSIHVASRLRKSLLNPDYALVRLRLAPGGQRLLIWFLTVAAFPLLVSPITLRPVRRRNAMANLVLMAVYSLLLILWSVFVLGPVVAWWQGLFMVAVSAAVIWYMCVTGEALAGLSGKRGG